MIPAPSIANRLQRRRVWRLPRKTAMFPPGLFAQNRGHSHWAYDYAHRLMDRVAADRSILIQTSMSPTGTFHCGNFRDTATAYLVHRALGLLGRRSTILLSFDDFDPQRTAQATRDHELAPYGGRPLAANQARSTVICRRYIAELKAVGICPDKADIDGRTTSVAEWQTHYQCERYLGGTYRRLQRRFLTSAKRLARILGVGHAENLFAVYCEQCGRNTTRILHLDPERLRYVCRSCGALTTTQRLDVVKPSWALDWVLRVTHEGIDCEPAGPDHCTDGSTMIRTQRIYDSFLRTPQPVIVPYGLVRQGAERAKISGSRGGGLTLSDLLAVMPRSMVLWLYARTNCLSDFRLSLGRAALFRYYDEYDAFSVAAAAGERRAAALHALITDIPPVVGLPRFRTLLGDLHSACYDVDAVVAARGSSPAVAERAIHARTWLRLHGRGDCWITRTASASFQPVLINGELPQRWTRARYRALTRALFDTDSGPPLRRLREVFGTESILTALRMHEPGGARPLRDRVLANLGQPTNS